MLPAMLQWTLEVWWARGGISSTGLLLPADLFCKHKHITCMQ
jgi:hypothetical protein